MTNATEDGQIYANQGKTLYQQGNYSKALESLLAALDIDSSLTDAWQICGEIYARLMQYENAVNAFSNAIQHAPEDASLYYRLGQALQQKGDMESAEHAFRNAIKANASYVESYNQLALLLVSQNRHDDAIGVYNDILSIDSSYAVGANNLGKLYFFYKNEPYRAIPYFEQAINSDSSYAPAHQSLGNALFMQGKVDEAISSMQKAVASNPNQHEYLNNLAAFLRYAGRLDEASDVLDRVININPDNTEALAGKAEVLQRQQDFSGSYEIIRSLLDKGIRSPNIAIVLANVCRKFDACDEAIQLINKILSGNIPQDGRRPLHYSLGKLYDAKSEYRLAFEHYRLANELEKNVFDVKKHSAFIDALTETYSVAFENRTPASSIKTNRPVFIVGMPRSGTILVEQILASHPDVYGAGELDSIGRLTIQSSKLMDMDIPYPYCMTGLSQQTADVLAKEYLDQLEGINSIATKITDKMPQNFLHIGFIRKIFPQAKIIHCIRNPLDTCLSIYFQSFGDFHSYASNLKNIAAFYADYARLMQHWKRVFSDNLYMEIEYENLVHDIEPNSRKLLNYCNLEWNDNCLEFYKTGRTIATASYDQVRQPVYTKSVARWKHYSQELGPLIDELKKLGLNINTD